MDGVLVIDKPEGITSHDVVSVARRALHERRIGHTGTLDPLATGVLPLALGRATRLVRFLMASDKDYEASIRFGVTTDTYDITGQEVARVPARVPAAMLTAALDTLRGRYLQTPPPHSAKRVEGRRAYELARRAEPVVLEPVPVHVSELTLLAADQERCSVRLTVSAGFYVRSFAHELGRRLGTGACLETLRRTRSGEFGLERAIGLEELTSEDEAAGSWVIPMAELLPSLPGVRLTDEGRLRVSHGRLVDPAHYTLLGGTGPEKWCGGAEGPSTVWVRLLDTGSQLVAIARPGPAAGSLHPQVVLT